MKTAIVVATPEVIVNVLGLSGKIESLARRVAGLGYDGIELFVSNPNKVDWKKLKDLVKQSKLKIPAIGTGPISHYGLTFCSPKAKVRKMAVRKIKDYLKLAKKLDSKIIIGSVKGKWIKSYEKGWKNLKGCLEECSNKAEKLDVKILIEPLNRYESNIVNTVSEACKLCGEIDSKQLEVMGDTFHMNIEEKSIVQAIKNSGKFLDHFHLADSNRKAPGLGHLDFESIGQALKEIDYDKFISAEILPKPNQFAAAKSAIKVMNKLKFDV